ncbi:MAG: hypothetical protein IJ188_08220 [Clostridia bacterium]|nr:hypothetical protein [Clostridia bacterium]
MEQDRTKTMQHIADGIQILLDQITDGEIDIYYMRMDDRQMARFGEWERSKFHLVKGDEYFLISKCGVRHYMVNVTGDSDLTAIKELIDKIAAKF